MADKKYTVTGAFVTVKTTTERGPTVVGLYQGAPWPDDATPEATQHHLDNKLIAEVGAPSPTPEALAEPVPAPQEPDAPEGEPAGPKPTRPSAGALHAAQERASKSGKG
jgi:hypothetical protein